MRSPPAFTWALAACAALCHECAKPLLVTNFAQFAVGATYSSVHRSIDKRPWESVGAQSDGHSYTFETYPVMVGMRSVTGFDALPSSPGRPSGPRTVNRAVIERYVLVFRDDRLVWHGMAHHLHRDADAHVRSAAAAAPADHGSGRCPKDQQWPVIPVLAR